MLRRVSALFFLAGMMTLLLFQQPVFAYCAHSEQFFLNDCGCTKPVGISCPHCRQDQPEQPCDDCSEKIQLEVDDLLWSDLTLNPPGTLDPAISEEADEVLPFGGSGIAEATSVHPPPPPRTIPLFLLHLAFRL